MKKKSRRSKNKEEERLENESEVETRKRRGERRKERINKMMDDLKLIDGSIYKFSEQRNNF